MDSERLLLAFRALSPKQEKILRLRFGIGCDRKFTFLEMARDFGITPSDTRSFFVRTLSQFRKQSGFNSDDLAAYGVSSRREMRSSILLAEFPLNKERVEVASAVNRLLAETDIHRERLLVLTPRQFEELIAEIWAKLGYSVELTARTRDNGRDVIAVRRVEAETRYLIECKRYAPEKKVGVEFVRALYGVKVDDKATKAFLATTSTFTRGALKFCENHRWELEARDFDGVLKWIEQTRRQ